MSDETQEMVMEAVPQVLYLLPVWEGLSWREQRQLADSLHYLAAAMRDVAERANLTEMQQMHQRNDG